MTDTTIVAVGLLVLFALLALRVPVALCLAAAGTLGIILVSGLDVAISTLASIPFSSTVVYSLTVVPMFVLMGLLVSNSGMLDGLFDVAERATRRLPGGLGVGTVGAAAFLGGISGSSAADAAAIGRVAIGEMSKRGYDRASAAAIVAAANTVAVLIPPSVVIVIFGITTAQPIGPLLLAGIVPGILTAVAYALLIMYMARRKSRRARVEPPEPMSIELRSQQPVLAGQSTPLQRIYAVLGGGLLFTVVVGGLYIGLFTATEAAAVGAFAGLLIGSIYMGITTASEGRLSSMLRAGRLSVREGVALTSMVFALIIGASIFTQFLVLTGVPRAVGAWVLSWDVAPAVVVAAFLLLLIPMGMFIDGLSMMLVVAPIAYPIVTELGFSGIWFAILFVKMIEIGLLTPPVGLNIYVVASLFPDLKAEAIFARILPFILIELIVTALLFTFPEIVTFLPDISKATG
ncbi:TRAP transporter large permease [Ornithinimicrobium murale]|uniref:TRAP transporter large permease n=1 Tax=Ornithinimicrobium murale TaxID=1050153 RepID=UPI000E0D97A1|nr:TRAP transporter large permease subunit [Ornithinimicrobium murale]